MTRKLLDKSTTIIIRAAAGEHLSARALFTHLGSVISECSFAGESVLTIQGDGIITLLDQTGRFRKVYRPDRRPFDGNWDVLFDEAAKLGGVCELEETSEMLQTTAIDPMLQGEG